MKIRFLGAAGTVTGSMHEVLLPGGGRVLLDCGLYQGRRQEARERNEHLPVALRELRAVVLSHAHIDHSGALPRLVALGYRGPIYATPATRDLIAVMLQDAAMIQQADADYINRRIRREHPDVEPVEPLYTLEDVMKTLEQVVAVPYHQPMDVAPGARLTFHDAGHVLGSALVALDLDEEGAERRLLFTGDLGRRDMPILRDPEVPPRVQVLLSESTYGDREHEPIEQMDEELGQVVRRVVDRGGRVLVPTFALERAQEIVFALKRLREAGAIPKVPVYVDSPLTVRVTDVFRLHPEAMDAEARRWFRGRLSPFDFEGLRYVQSVEESKALSASREPAVVLSASGMCEFGRVLHHLRAMVGDPRSCVVIVGWQAPHTLGRRLVEGRSRVRIFGVEHERRCEVVVLGGFSAHAGRSELLDFAEAVRQRGPLRHVALVHGEPPAQQALAEGLAERGFPDVRIPRRGETLRF